MINSDLFKVIGLIILVNWEPELFAPTLGVGRSLTRSLDSYKSFFFLVACIDIKKKKVDGN